MTDCECPHMYGLQGYLMCTMVEQTTEHHAPGDLEFYCKHEDQRDFVASKRGTIEIEGSCCPVANRPHYISKRIELKIDRQTNLK